MDYVRDELKVYDPSMLQARAQGSQVVMHVFEKSVELPKHAAQREYYDPLQVRGLGQGCYEALVARSCECVRPVALTPVLCWVDRVRADHVCGEGDERRQAALPPVVLHRLLRADPAQVHAGM